MNTISPPRSRIDYRWVVFITIAIGTFVSVLDQSSVNLALPRIAEHFNATLTSVQWIPLSYMLVTGSLLLAMGRLGDVIGRKTVYAVGFAIFSVGAVLAGTSTALFGVVLFKALQGIGSAMVQGTGMAIVTAIFPDEERGKVIGLFLTVVGIGAIAGPVVGGQLVDVFGWRSVFLVGVPFGVVSVIASLAVLKSDAEERAEVVKQKQGFDWIGAALSSLALIVLLLVMTNANRVEWNPAIIVPGFGFFVVLIGTFVWWEGRVPAPMLAMEFFKNRLFSFGSAASFLSFFAGTSVFFLMPFYLQDVLGLSPGVSGLIIVPTAICFALFGPIAGRLSDRYGWQNFAVTGLAFSAVALLILSQLSANPPIPLVITALVLQGIGMGTFFSPNASAIMSTVGRSSYGITTAYLNMVRNTANVTGVGVATTIVVIVMASQGFEPSLDTVSSAAGGEGIRPAFLQGLKTAYLVMFGVTLIALALTLVKGQSMSNSKIFGSPDDAAHSGVKGGKASL